MAGVSTEIQQRQVGHFTEANPPCGAAAARKIAALAQ
jgi:hypothetical protein